MVRNIMKKGGILVFFCNLLWVAMGSSANGYIPCESVSTLSNMTLGRLKRGTDLDLFMDKGLPLPSEVLDNLFSRRLFNTTMNYIVPCFEVTLPLRTEDGNTIHLAMQAFLGLFSAIAWIATVAIPLVLTEIVPFGFKKRNFGPDSNSFFEYKLTSTRLGPLFNKNMAKKIGLEWDACLRKTICQAHRAPETYGIFALPFVAFFSPQNAMSQENRAAYIGRATQEDCDATFHCFFDVLDLSRYLYQAFLERKQQE